ncbi:MAG: HlyD family secretion protein [Firmicutes bacterium]|nr:HlyD family secretion protein [Bacillota bacterium]
MSKRKIIYLVFVLMLVTMAGISMYYWYQKENYVTTEDAKVDGKIVKIIPQITGKILDFPIEEGALLTQDQYVARLDDTNLPSGGNYNLTTVKAPITGTVLKKLQNPGEVASPGQPLALMADLNSVYITANIEETYLAKVKPGQKVEFTIDAIPKHRFFGRVESIGQATNSVFSLLPSNTSGNFTKVTQRIPVKISIDDFQGQQLLPGMNAVVKIYIR